MIINRSHDNAPVMDLDTGGNDLTRFGWTARDVTVGDLDEVSVSAGSIGEHTILHQSVEIAMQRRWRQYYDGSRARLRGIRRMPVASNGLWPETLHLSIEGGKQKERQEVVYRNVCTEREPPQSVAISPFKRCVAFGCDGGIELYWVDPQTGQDLNRWFPLVKPSDHLYFLPPRRHIDADSRLRLIASSKYQSPSTGSLAERPVSEADGTSRVSSWFTLSASWQFTGTHGARQRPHALDHSQAVPLRDGYHILFLDNATGLLCLGSDKPVGSVYRLSRKCVFIPPALQPGEDSSPPETFAAAQDPPNSGVRVVAAYSGRIVLYTVPSDVLAYSTAEQEGTIHEPSATPFEKLKTLQVLRHPLSNAPAVREYCDESARFKELNMRWVHYLPDEDRSIKCLDELWPLNISGKVVGYLEGVVTLSVRDAPEEGLTIWAFGKFVTAKAWRLDDGVRPLLCERSKVDGDGVVREVSIEAIQMASGTSRWDEEID